MKKSFKELLESQQLNEFAMTSDDSGQQTVAPTVVNPTLITEPLILGISDRTAPDYDAIMGNVNTSEQVPSTSVKKQPFIFGINDRSIPKFDE